MTISSQTSRISYTGNGSTTAYAVPFYFAANADLVVYLTSTSGTQTLQVLGTNYTLTGATLSAGGTCTFITAPPTGYIVAIYRDPALTQTTSYNNNDPFPAKSHEMALDKALTIDQRTRDLVTRAIHLADGETTIATTLAAAATRANKLLGFDTAGALAYRDSPTFVGSTALGVADVSTRATAAGTRFPAGTTVVTTAGYYTAGDGGGGNYVAGTISGPGAFQDGSGNWWQLESGKSFNVRQFGAKGDGVATDTTAIQSAFTAANAVGSTVLFPPGQYLTGALTWSAANGGAIYAAPGTASLIPNANSVTFITQSNTYGTYPVIVDGLTFDNTIGKTGITGIVVADFIGVEVKNIITHYLDYVLKATASSGGQNSYNVTIANIIQYGTGSFEIRGFGSKRVFDVNISNVMQFTGNSDTWAAPWFKFTRAITVLMTNVHGQSLSGSTSSNNIGVQIAGSCEGIFLSNVVIPFPYIGIVCDLSNGDVVAPAWIYFSNVGVDQATVNAVDLLCSYFRWANGNITGGTSRLNSGSGLLIRTGCVDYSVFGVQINGMYHDGLTVQTGTSQGQFFGCNFNTNFGSGSGFDVDIIAKTPRDPLFIGCRMGTFTNNGGVGVVNGGSTSRYVYSNRGQVLSAAGSGTFQSVTMPAGTLVDGKSYRVTCSGTFAANANAKAVTITFAGVTIATMSGNFNNVSFVMKGEVFRIDATNIWRTGESIAGTTVTAASSALSSSFDTSIASAFAVIYTGVANSDIALHRVDIELLD